MGARPGSIKIWASLERVIYAHESHSSIGQQPHKQAIPQSFMVSLCCLVALCMAPAAAAQTSNVVELPISAFGTSDSSALSIGADHPAAPDSTNASASTPGINMLPSTSAVLDRTVAGSSQATKAFSPSELPIFYFHGLTGTTKDGANIAAKMTADGRTIHLLDFCEGECSMVALHTQVPLAIAQIRSIIAKDPDSYADGYIFVAHSQGGMVSRAVIEEMDDHNALMFISLAGLQNGVFYGPQAADAVPLQLFANFVAPATIPTMVLDISKYSPDQMRGQMQHDFLETLATTPDLGNEISSANLWRSPDYTPWLSWNSWLPMINNLQVCADTECEQAQARRKSNFLKLKAFYSFASARDGVIAPWQTSHFAKYSDLPGGPSEIITNFERLTIVPMEQTPEYIGDTYGLKSLHTSGRLHLREVDDVSHGCWISDGPFFDDPSEMCSFDAVFDAHVYPLLASTIKLGSDSCAGCQ